MSQKTCLAPFSEIPFVDSCDPCRHFYFQHVQKVPISTGTLITTLTYDLRTCFEGLAKGAYLNALTLLPGEELEVEIIERAKFEKALHESSSLETEFEDTFKYEMMDKFTSTSSSNASGTVSGEVNFIIGSLEASGTWSSSSSYFRSVSQEVTKSVSERISRRQDISISTKSEIENTFRSLRKFKNPNPCQPVLYLISQLQKKYNSSLHLIKVEFDYVPKQNNLPEFLSKQSDSIKIKREAIVPYNNKVAHIIGSTPQSVLSAEISSGLSTRTPIQNSEIQQAKIEKIQIHKKEWAQLSNASLLSQIEDKKEKDTLNKSIEAVLKDKDYQLGEIYSFDHCIRTSDIFIETKISECSACTAENIKEQNANIDKTIAETQLITSQAS